MKTLFQILIVFVLITLLSGCHSSGWLSRKYTAGIFVEHTSGIKQTQGATCHEKKSSCTALPKNLFLTNFEVPILIPNNVIAIKTDQAYASSNKVLSPDNLGQELTSVSSKSKEIHSDFEKKKVSTALRDQKSNANSIIEKISPPLDEQGMFILLLVLSLLVPPLAIYLKNQKIGKWFWISLVCCLFAGGILFNVGFLGTAWLAAFIIALLVVLEILK